MRKLVLVLTGMVMCAFFAACTSIDSKLDSYEKACKDGDYAKVLELAGELDKVKDKMTQEQIDRSLKISLNCK